MNNRRYNILDFLDIFPHPGPGRPDPRGVEKLAAFVSWFVCLGVVLGLTVIIGVLHK